MSHEIADAVELGRAAAIMVSATEGSSAPFSDQELVDAWHRGVAEGQQQIRDALALKSITEDVLRERR